MDAQLFTARRVTIAALALLEMENVWNCQISLSTVTTAMLGRNPTLFIMRTDLIGNARIAIGVSGSRCSSA